MKRSVFRSLALAASAAIALSACGGGGDDAAEAPSDADVVVGALDALVFDAESYTATAGDVDIAYVNRGSVAHTLLVLDADQKAIGPKLTLPGGGEEEGTYTLAAGTYLLFCDVPGHGNMKATLTVT